MAKRISEMENYAEFIKVCRYERCKEEYPDWVGDERYIVYSSLKREMIETRFPEIVKEISPYIIMDADMRKVVFAYNHNEQRNLQKQLNTDCLDILKDTIDNLTNLEDGFIKKEEVSQQMTKLKEILTEKQYTRLLLHLGYGYTIKEIAHSEGSAISTVSVCVNTAIKRINAYLSKIQRKEVM